MHRIVFSWIFCNKGGYWYNTPHVHFLRKKNTRSTFYIDRRRHSRHGIRKICCMQSGTIWSAVLLHACALSLPQRQLCCVHVLCLDANVNNLRHVTWCKKKRLDTRMPSVGPWRFQRRERRYKVPWSSWCPLSTFVCRVLFAFRSDGARGGNFQQGMQQLHPAGYYNPAPARTQGPIFWW